MSATLKKTISNKKFDKLFDEGKEDILQYCDLDSSLKRINVDFPIWMVKELDDEAEKLGINRQAVIKTWISSMIHEKKKIHALLLNKEEK